MAIIDPHEVLDLGTDTIEAADIIVAAGLRAQRVIDDVGALAPGVVAPDVARTFALLAAELVDQGMIAKTRAEDLLGNERPLSGLADLVGADYWTPAPRDPGHPLAHEFPTAEVALSEAIVDRYLPPGGGTPVTAEAVADSPPRRWTAMPAAAVDEPPVTAAWQGARAAHHTGGAAAGLVPGTDTAVAAAAGGLAGVTVGMTTTGAPPVGTDAAAPTHQHRQGEPLTDGE